MENMVHHGECLEPASGPIDRGTCPEGRCFFQSGTISLTTELFLPSHPRTPQFDQGQSILLPTTAHQEHHQVHSQRDGTYTVQRLLRDWTSLPDLSIQPTHRTRDMDRRPSSQNRCHTDLLLVAAQRHRSSSSDNITCLAPDDSHRTDNIPDLASPENRLSRCLCRSRALLHLPISPAFPTHMPTPRHEETPRQDAQEIPSPVPTPTRNASDTQRIGPHHLTGPIDPDLSFEIPSNWPGPPWKDQAQQETPEHDSPNTHAVCPHQIGILTRGSPTHWPMGLRRHQTLHPRSTIAASTRSQPPCSNTQRDDQPTSQEPSPTRGTSPPTPILDLQPHDQGMPRTGSSRNMHWQCPLGDTLRMELRNIPLPQTDDQTHGTLLRQVQILGQRQRDRPGLRGRQLRDPS